MRNFSPVSEMRKGQRSRGRVLAPNLRSKANMAKHKNFTFTPMISSATLKAVSLQLNGMLMMWKIQQAMKDDGIWTARIHPAFFPVTGLKCSYGKISSPLTEISGTEPARPLMNTSKIKGFRGNARSRKPGQPGQSDSEVGSRKKIPCEQRFLSCMAFSAYEVIRVAVTYSILLQ